MATPQPGILLPIPPLARYLTFSLQPGVNPRGALQKLAALADGKQLVAGIGESLAFALGRRIEGLRAFPSFTDAFEIPSTPSAIWIWARGEDGASSFTVRAWSSVLARIPARAGARRVLPRSRPRSDGLRWH
jgi:hypothetical protein